uniref:Helicase ATP-binding domain-containing protein n=1 Tax=Chenopodium quinoa TaxID=63459 RepID=A0A803NA62_CHEQI
MAATKLFFLPISDNCFKLSSYPQLSTISINFKCPCRRHCRKPQLLICNAVYTEGGSRTKSSFGKEKVSDSEFDPISALNERIRRDHGTRDSTKPALDSKEAEKYIQLVKQQQQRGLEKLKGKNKEEKGGGKESGGISYKVDPYTLKSGDYVVHKKVGIGRFVGIKYDMPKDGSEPIEYVFIEFGDGMAKLPVKQASRMLYRYNLPNEPKKPRTLSKLNDTSAWEKRRTKGKVAVQKMVVDLMELYLHRLKQKRPPYPKCPSMDEFTSQFLHEPTPDQKQAFIDVEKDLTDRETPMDRLICGDVGFGKTEVALRAVFCVVSAGKQAMVLAPTIVLAKQHFDVISERFSMYPNIKVGLLSRFQTRGEKEEYLRQIKKGELDIIVGTHSLLGNRVVYNNLGLLVVDEEQLPIFLFSSLSDHSIQQQYPIAYDERFGVKQKEKIASFKTSVDVLTLSATPIPRTLYLALTGFRDASLISTPPPERVPIKTQLSAFSKENVVSAIKYELDRDGQVFYVLPRIKGLEEVMGFLEQSFPDVEIAIAHGKLRGRVGRSDKEAYAYLFYPDKSLLSDQALERLSALEECRELGQGFQLAERDMGIRGFGNIFGEQQTGDVGNVGIDLFFEMLFESLSKIAYLENPLALLIVNYDSGLVSQVEEHRIRSIPYQDVQLDINVNPHLSSEYINYLENPMELINDAEKAAEKDILSLVKFTEDLRRQYGKEPNSMEILLKKLYVKRMAADLGINRICVIGRIVGMETNMTKDVFRMIKDSMASDVLRSSLVYDNGQIKTELLLELPREQLLNWIFQCLGELHASLPALIKY